MYVPYGREKNFRICKFHKDTTSLFTKSILHKQIKKFSLYFIESGDASVKWPKKIISQKIEN